MENEEVLNIFKTDFEGKPIKNSRIWIYNKTYSEKGNTLPERYSYTNSYFLKDKHDEELHDESFSKYFYNENDEIPEYLSLHNIHTRNIYYVNNTNKIYREDTVKKPYWHICPRFGLPSDGIEIIDNIKIDELLYKIEDYILLSSFGQAKLYYNSLKSFKIECLDYIAIRNLDNYSSYSNLLKDCRELNLIIPEYLLK